MTQAAQQAAQSRRRWFPWLIGLGAVAAVIAAALLLPPPGLLAQGPGAPLARGMDAIARVEVTRAGTRIVAVTADMQRWTLASAADAPADSARIRAFLIDLARLGDAGARAPDTARHAELGLGPELETRVLISDAAGTVVSDLRFGKPVEGEIAGRYARLGDAAQTFVATGVPPLPRRTTDWIAVSLPELAPGDVRAIVITTPQLERIVLRRGPDQRFGLETPATGTAQQGTAQQGTTNEARAEAMASLFARLGYADVVAANSLAWNGATSYFITFADGMDLSGLAMVRDGRAWLRLNASAPSGAAPDVRARAEAINALRRLAFAVPEDKARLLLAQPADLMLPTP